MISPSDMERTSIVGFVLDARFSEDNKSVLIDFEDVYGDKIRVSIKGFLLSNSRDYSPGNMLKVYGSMDESAQVFKATELAINPPRSIP
jgi:hypothetical protein